MFTQRKEKPPAKSPNCLSRVTYWYLNDFFAAGRKRPITAKDFFEPGIFADQTHNLSFRSEILGEVTSSSTGVCME